MKKSFFILLCCIYGSLDLYSQGLFENALASESDDSGGMTLNGFVRTVSYLSTNSDDELIAQSLYSQFGLTSTIEIGQFGKGYADFRYRYGNEFDNITSEILLKEAYVDLFFNALKLRVGKQIVNWGACSFVNPTDQFAPVDPVYRSPYKEDMQLGNWMLNSELSISSSSSLQVFWTPLYQPSVLMTSAVDFPEYISFAEKIPAPVLKKSSFGINYDLRSKYLDLELSFYHGYRNYPSIRFDSAVFNMMSFEPEAIMLETDPFIINSLGLNVTIPVKDYLFRIEANWRDINNDEPEYIPLNEFSYCAEIEQSGSSVSIIGGYYGKYNIDYSKMEYDPEILTGSFPDPGTFFPPGTTPDLAIITNYLQDQIKGFNRLYEYQDHEFYHSVYAIAKVNLFNETVELEIPGMYNFTAKELTLMPGLTFFITDGLKVRAGAYCLRGDENTMYGMVKQKLNAAYLLFQATF